MAQFLCAICRKGVKRAASRADDMVVSDIDGARCPKCGAFARTESQWCTLCYADLRPAPEPVAATVPVSVGSVPAPFDPLTAPLDAVMAGPRHAASSHAVGDERPDAESTKGWPCSRCETVVPFDESACPTCGTRFLEGAHGEPELAERLGGQGMSNSTQIMIMVGGSFALVAVIITVMYIAGAIF